MLEDNRRWTFSLEEAFLWIMDWCFGQKWWFKVKMLWWWICFLQTCSFSLHNILIDVLEWCGLLWCFYQLFGLSFWRHPFTAEDPLVSKWSNATFLQICSDEETNSNAHLGWSEGESTFSAVFQLWMNCSFKVNVQLKMTLFAVLLHFLFLLHWFIQNVVT